MLHELSMIDYVSLKDRLLAATTALVIAGTCLAYSVPPVSRTYCTRLMRLRYATFLYVTLLTFDVRAGGALPVVPVHDAHWLYPPPTPPPPPGGLWTASCCTMSPSALEVARWRSFWWATGRQRRHAWQFLSVPLTGSRAALLLQRAVPLLRA